MSAQNQAIGVMHLSSSLYRGGAERLLVDFVEKAGKDYKDVELYVVVMNQHIDEGLKNELLDSCSHVTFLHRAEGHKHPKYLFSIVNIIRRNHIRIIHTHDYGSKMWSVACKIFVPGLKLVHTVHDTNIISKYSKLNLLLHKAFISCNIAISKSVYDECIRFGVTRTRQIYNGICTKRFQNGSQRGRNGNETFKIINVSRIVHDKKGQDILLKALKICKDKGVDFQCTFVGDTEGADRPSYEYLLRLAESLGIEKKIVFLGKRNDVPLLLREQDLFVLCSRYEGLGLVVLEAMAAGLPVIASNIDGPRELIKDGETGILFQPEDALELSDKILLFYRDRALMNRIAKCALSQVNRFDISVMCKQYVDLYKEMVGIKNE